LAAIFVVLLGPSLCRADDTADEIKWLRQKVQELEEKVRALENANKSLLTNSVPQLQELEKKVGALEEKQNLDAETAQEREKTAPLVSLGGDGFTLASPDKNFAIQLKGVLQVDSRTFFSDAIKGNDGLLLRRARPILQGTVFRDFDFVFVPDFGGTAGPQIFDAYINYRYRPELQLRIGKFKSPVGLEQLQPDPDTWFNERALPTDLTPNRDIGAQFHGEALNGVFSYALGIFNGVGDSRNSINADVDDNKAFAGRVFFRPFRDTTSPLQGLGFGLGGSYEKMQGTNTAGLPSTTGGTLAGYTTDGQQQFFAYNPASNAVVVADGEHWRLAPQGYYFLGPLGLHSEYVISDQRVTRVGAAPVASRRLANTGWEVSASWLLTGEDSVYTGPVLPRNPFDPREGRWGALQLVGRYAELHIDENAFPLFANPGTSAHAALSWAVGLNWYLNRNIAIKASYSHTDFRGVGIGSTTAPGNVTRTDEDVFFTRVQLAF
jgi:phosphate-selective porin OprO/OprP